MITRNVLTTLFFLASFWAAGQQQKTILAIFPHPDDESAIAEVLLKYAEMGYRVQLIIATDGKDGTRVTKIPAGDSLGTIRKEETRCACKILGIEPPIYLGIDRLDTRIGVGKYFAEHKKLLSALKQQIEAIDPAIILTFGPDGDTRHAEHIVTGAAVTELLLREGWVDKYPLYYLAWTKEQGQLFDLGYVHPQYYNVKIAYSQQHENKALEMMPCYVTQFTPEELVADRDKKLADTNHVIHFRRFGTSQDALSDDFFNNVSGTYKKRDDDRNAVKSFDGFETGTLAETGIDAGIIRRMTDSIESGNYTNIHSVLILKHNKLVYEKYWPGEDVVRGKGPAGFVNHHRDSMHDVRSITKSIVGAAVLLAHAQGRIKSLDQRVFDFFPEYAKYDTGTKQQITIQHLLNMTAGLDWDEEISYNDPRNSEIQMGNAPNAVAFVLSQPMVHMPGTRFRYSGGCTQLLAEIVQRVTGLRVDSFTARYLFKPLGINQYTWVKNPDGSFSAASGLRMRSRDLAKFGLLFLNDGKWQGTQLIPLHLVAQTMQSQAMTHDADSIVLFSSYSNQFWIYTENLNNNLLNFVQCQGNGGQIILIDRKNDLVMVITAGNYNQRNLRKSSYDIYPDFVYPAINQNRINDNSSYDVLTAYLKNITYQAIMSEFRLDTAFIATLMDENFISIYPHKTQNKQQELDGIYKGIVARQKEKHTMDSLYLDDFKVKFFDKTAIASFYTVSRGTKKGKPYKDYRMRWYDVWVNRNGEWKWVSSQGTVVEK